MRRQNALFALLLAMGMLVSGAQIVWAGEHGGGSAAGSKEHGGKAAEGSHGHEDHAAVLKQAADVLQKEGHADLAAKVRAIANE